MSEKDKSYIDPELEKFIRENKEMLERLFRDEMITMRRFCKGEKDLFEETFREERKKAEEFADEQRKKAKEAAQGMFNAFTDPEVQKHFMAMGMEFMMTVGALMSAMPFPDCFKDMADKAEEARKNASENFSKANAGRGSGSKPAAPEKIDIESAPKKTSSAKKGKTSD
ncbi:MAG: hypothetical protein FWG96_06205 [Methanomassiliicoccaceae archaeon]|nr:hypothetical protein [Methanomassiliicoccaceae archaeon]